MSEKDIQTAIYWYRRGIAIHPLLFPNIYLYPDTGYESRWESDLLYVSDSNYVTEFEIKCTRQDFLRDAGKVRKHELLGEVCDGPAYFYYVCPRGLILPCEIPTYAGLLYVDPTANKWDMATEVKKPKRRKGAEPINKKTLDLLLLKGLSHLWNQRAEVQGD